VSLYDLLGWPAFVGVGVMASTLPINTYLGTYLKTLQVQQMQNRDGRTRMMSELLNNMKSIKLYGWEKTFIAKIQALRNNKEMHTLKRIGIVTSCTTVLWGLVFFFVYF